MYFFEKDVKTFLKTIISMTPVNRQIKIANKEKAEEEGSKSPRVSVNPYCINPRKIT